MIAFVYEVCAMRGVGSCKVVTLHDFLVLIDSSINIFNGDSGLYVPGMLVFLYLVLRFFSSWVAVLNCLILSLLLTQGDGKWAPGCLWLQTSGST
jgi:hypothetical protein